MKFLLLFAVLASYPGLGQSGKLNYSINTGGSHVVATGGGSLISSVGQIFQYTEETSAGAVNEGVLHVTDVATSIDHNAPAASPKFTAYPNPTSGVIWVSSKNAEPQTELLSLQVYNNVGKLLSSQAWNRFGDNGIDLSGLPAAFYLIRIVERSGVVHTLKINKAT